MKRATAAVRAELHFARTVWGPLSRSSTALLRALLGNRLSVAMGDITLINGRWYVTHTGLLRLAKRHRCVGIHVRAVDNYCDLDSRSWAFEATVYRFFQCRGFVGYGDADPVQCLPARTRRRNARGRDAGCQPRLA